jgi:ABC-type Fe3+ transport system substrate-binding protein
MAMFNVIVVALQRSGVILCSLCLAFVSGCNDAALDQGEQPGNAAELERTSIERSPSAGAPRASWEAELDRLAAAAAQEGELRVYGHSGTERRDVLLEFERAYPAIDLKITASASDSAEDARLQAEWEEGVFHWDVLAAGDQWLLRTYETFDHLQPIEALIVRPDILDDANWLGGFHANFMDDAGRYIYMFHIFIAETAFIRTDLVSQSEIATQGDLADPRFRGRIGWVDPRMGGMAAVQASFIYRTHGSSVLRQLLTTQEPQVFANAQQLMQNMLRTDDIWIAIGVDRPVLKKFTDEGLGTTIEKLECPDCLSQGGTGGFIAVPKAAPHPNAAKLFVNWMLSAAGQTAWTRISKENSRRLDVPVANPERNPAPDSALYDFGLEVHDHYTTYVNPTIRLAEEALSGN